MTTFPNDSTEEFDLRATPTFEEMLAAAPWPDPDGGLDLTDEEFQSFLRAVRE